MFKAESDRYEEIPFSDELLPIRINYAMSPYKTVDTVPQPADYEVTTDLTWHEALEILYIISGQAVVMCGGSVCICREGDVIVINPCELHNVYGYISPPVYHCIMIDPKLYDTNETVYSEKYTTPLKNGSIRFNSLIRGDDHLCGIINELVTECENTETGYELTIKGDILRILSVLFRTQQKKQNDSEPSEVLWYRLISPALLYIAANYNRKIRLDTLADLCHMNRSYFCDIFRRTTGKTTVTYINEYRLTKAMTFITGSELDISEIAYKTGFEDSGYFSRKFKEYHKCTPSEARNKYSGGNYHGSN